MSFQRIYTLLRNKYETEKNDLSFYTRKFINVLIDKTNNMIEMLNELQSIRMNSDNIDYIRFLNYLINDLKDNIVIDKHFTNFLNSYKILIGLELKNEIKAPEKEYVYSQIENFFYNKKLSDVEVYSLPNILNSGDIKSIVKQVGNVDPFVYYLIGLLDVNYLKEKHAAYLKSATFSRVPESEAAEEVAVQKSVMRKDDSAVASTGYAERLQIETSEESPFEIVKTSKVILRPEISSPDPISVGTTSEKDTYAKEETDFDEKDISISERSDTGGEKETAEGTKGRITKSVAQRPVDKGRKVVYKRPETSKKEPPEVALRKKERDGDQKESKRVPEAEYRRKVQDVQKAISEETDKDIETPSDKDVREHVSHKLHEKTEREEIATHEELTISQKSEKSKVARTDKRRKTITEDKESASAEDYNVSIEEVTRMIQARDAQEEIKDISEKIPSSVDDLVVDKTGAAKSVISLIKKAGGYAINTIKGFGRITNIIVTKAVSDTIRILAKAGYAFPKQIVKAATNISKSTYNYIIDKGISNFKHLLKGDKNKANYVRLEKEIEKNKTFFSKSYLGKRIALGLLKTVNYGAEPDSLRFRLLNKISNIIWGTDLVPEQYIKYEDTSRKTVHIDKKEKAVEVRKGEEDVPIKDVSRMESVESTSSKPVFESSVSESMVSSKAKADASMVEKKKGAASKRVSTSDPDKVSIGNMIEKAIKKELDEDRKTARIEKQTYRREDRKNRKASADDGETDTSLSIVSGVMDEYVASDSLISEALSNELEMGAIEIANSNDQGSVLSGLGTKIPSANSSPEQMANSADLIMRRSKEKMSQTRNEVSRFASKTKMGGMGRIGRFFSAGFRGIKSVFKKVGGFIRSALASSALKFGARFLLRANPISLILTAADVALKGASLWRAAFPRVSMEYDRIVEDKKDLLIRESMGEQYQQIGAAIKSPENLSKVIKNIRGEAGRTDIGDYALVSGYEKQQVKIQSMGVGGRIETKIEEPSVSAVPPYKNESFQTTAAIQSKIQEEYRVISQNNLDLQREIIELVRQNQMLTIRTDTKSSMYHVQDNMINEAMEKERLLAPSSPNLTEP